MNKGKKPRIITIDGPCGSGKSTVARSVAKKLNFTYLDTGAMYRAVALLAQRRNTNIENEKELIELLSDINITFERNSDHNFRLMLNGEDVTSNIRTLEVSRLSSDVATKRVVRTKLRQIQREIGSCGNIVAEGRDMGIYVFPEADCKFYIDADIEERAKRRWLQFLEGGLISI